MAGQFNSVEISQKLGRTRGAVHYRASELDVSLQIEDLSLKLVRKLFRAHAITIREHWLNTGLLASRLVVGRGRRLGDDCRIREIDLEAFIQDCPWAYDARRMFPQSHRLARLAMRVQRRDPWLSLNEVAQHFGLSQTAVLRWCQKGVIPCKHRYLGSGSNTLVVRERDLEAAAAEIAHRRGTARARSTTALLTANRRWRAEQAA